MYGLGEDQFRRLVDMALKSPDQTGVALLRLFRSRLDNIASRLGLASTHPQARHFVTHGLFRVSGERVDLPSYLVPTGAEIQELTEAGQLVPGWLERRDGGGVILREPNREEIDPDIQEQRIV